jgi:carboxyl-terminal processing protease
MNRLAKGIVTSLSLVVFLYVGLGYVLGKTDDDKTYRSLTVYSEVLQRVQEDYVDDPDLTVVTAGALHGLLESLDPYSGYYSPREYADFKDKQKKAGRGETGAVLAKRFGYIVVVTALPESPAEKAGLRDGDILEAIAGFTTREMSVGQANLLLEGQPGSTVKIAVVRRGRTEPQVLDVSRGIIPTPHLVASTIDDVAYLHPAALDSSITNEMRQKLVQFERQGVKKLILDLRDCARGSAAEGVAAAQLFLSSGTIAVLNGQTISKQEFTAATDKAAWRNPMEVLISDSTSGAAEIVAAAIGENQRGRLVGGRTFGSASEQKLVPLEDGSALVLTVGYYYTPKGKAILEGGVLPTVEVADAGAEADEAPETGAGAADAPPRPPANRLPSMEDPVLRKALELLNGKAA